MTPHHTTSAHPAEPKWHRRPESRPREILAAALAVFAESGYERATIADVARRAGVSPALVVHYFRTKAELFEAVVNDRFLDVVATEEALLASHRGTYRDLLHQLIRRFWEHCWTPGTAELAAVVKAERDAFPEATRTLFQQLSVRWRRLLEGVLDAGVRQGEFRLAGPEAARVIGAMVIGVVESARCLGGCDPRPSTPEELWTALIDLIDRGVVAQPGAATPPVSTPESSGISRQQGESQ